MGEIQAFKLPPVLPTLYTQDLVLRPITLADTDSYYALCSNFDVMRGWGTAPHRSKKETEELILFLEASLANNSMARWGIALREAPESIIGDVGYWRFVPVRYRGELGAKLLPAYWRQSYMSQALSRAITAGFENLGLNSVEGNIEPDNTASLRLVEKLGFKRDGYIKQHTYSAVKNRFVDTILFSIIKEDWRPEA